MPDGRNWMNGGRLICEDVDETITQDELDFGLKRWLRKTPEERYQEEKEDRYFHELSPAICAA